MRTVFNLLSLSACVSVTGLLFDKFILCEHLWCNWLACSAVNRKVAGSSPARCVPFLIILSLSACVSVTGLLSTLPRLDQYPVDKQKNYAFGC